jgi:putative phosphoesterase
MRIAIVSDVHGNFAALEAMVAELERERPELVVHGGDLALTGPRPAEVVDLVRELGWPGVVGNTDELLWRPELRAPLQEASPGLGPLLELLFEDYAPVTRGRLGEERIEWLRGLEAEWRGEGIALLHAAPGDLWRAPPPDADDSDLADAYGGLGTPLVVYCHIHQPFVHDVSDALTVANSGSVGMPFDGDPRVSYLLIEDGEASVRRVAYDVERHVADLSDPGYPDVERLAAVAREGRFVAP